MSTEPFIGEIKLFGGNFAMRGYMFCNGQLLSIAQNTALFSLLGTTYGGDGQTTFGLPDLRGRFPMHQGQGAGLSQRVMGQAAGSAEVTLTTNTIPGHTHTMLASGANGNTSNPSGAFWAAQPGLLQYTNSPNAAMNAAALAPAGNSLPHDNLDPFLAVSYVIAVEGIFPSRN